MPRCPECGEPGRPILYGLPTRRAQEAAAAGRVSLAGCMMPPEHDEWVCAGGHGWRTGDQEQLAAAIRSAIDG
ncbi:hypothetical protein GCM10009534_03540 [Kribbella sandramycini]